MIEDLGLYFNRSEELFKSDLSGFFGSTQMEVIRLKLEGYKNIEIAEKLKCCPATITKYVAEIRAVLREKVRNGSI